MICYNCGGDVTPDGILRVNVAENPEMKEKILCGEPFMKKCPHCGAVNMVKRPVLYHDPSHKLIVWLTDGDQTLERRMRELFVSDGGMEDYTGRIVDSIGDLVEKIKISDADLDDATVELCKFITASDMGKEDVRMKFYRMEGADNELTFTYPDSGRMEMVCVGFSVYEDCAAILRRNPDILSRTRGLVRLDEDFVSDILA